jgi:hypothetical protein
MVRSCRASCFCRLLSSCRCCRSSRRLRRFINGRRHAGTDTASCRAINSRRITAFQPTPGKLRLGAWRAATSAPGISIQSQVITGTMATGTISAGLAFTAVATMAAASALAGRGRRSGRSGIAARLLRKDRARLHPFAGSGGPWRKSGHSPKLPCAYIHCYCMVSELSQDGFLAGSEGCRLVQRSSDWDRREGIS